MTPQHTTSYIPQVFTIIHVDTFHGSKEAFPLTCFVTSFKIRNHYIVVNLTIVIIRLKIVAQAA